jgi:TIR domain
MGHIFVSHSSADNDVARDVVGHLERNGFKCWLASRDVDLGDDYASQVVRAVDRSDHVIVLVSAAANQSPHVRRELDRAVGSGRPIVPVRLGKVIASESLSYLLSGAQWVDLDSGTRDVALQRVVNVLQGGPSQLGSRPQIPFHEVLSKSTSDVGIKVKHPLATLAIVCSSSLVLAPLGVIFGLLYLMARDRPPEGRLVAGYAVFIGVAVIVIAGAIYWAIVEFQPDDAARWHASMWPPMAAPALRNG